MRKAIIAILLVGLIGGFLMVQRYLAAESAARTLRDQASNFPSLFRAATGDAPGSSATVKEVVSGLVAAAEGVTLAGDVEVVSILVEVGEGGTSCAMPVMPPEFKKLKTQDRGNVQNLAIRCRRDIFLIGFRAEARGPTGKRFELEEWTYARGFSG